MRREQGLDQRFAAFYGCAPSGRNAATCFRLGVATQTGAITAHPSALFPQSEVPVSATPAPTRGGEQGGDLRMPRKAASLRQINSLMLITARHSARPLVLVLKMARRQGFEPWSSGLEPDILTAKRSPRKRRSRRTRIVASDRCSWR